MRYLILFIVLFIQGCTSLAQEKTNIIVRQKAERKQFQKSSFVMKSPTKYLMRDSEKGAYDPKPKVVPVNESEGKYEFRWIGYDGKQKVVAYQRADAINAVVEAGIVRNEDGSYTYKYLIRNSSTSPTFVSGFAVQSFASDITPDVRPYIDNIYVGHMSNQISVFREGVWRRFAPLEEARTRSAPGKTIEFSLVSKAVPGIVGCKATGGELTLVGAGEHMPTELENEMAGYDEWASCHSFGPIDKLSEMTKTEKAKYVLDNLSKFVEAGWMAGDTPKLYEIILKRNDLAGALEQAKKDIEQGYITSEVFHIIEGLNR